MGRGPINNYGLLGFLQPLPILAASAVPIMFFIDWWVGLIQENIINLIIIRVNRPAFEKVANEVLRGPDMSDILGFYSKSPASRFLVLDYDKLPIGIIAIDASDTSRDTSGSEIRASSEGSEKLGREKTSIATIRHFYVDEAYRRSGVQEDLLRHAIRHAFNSDKAIQQIQVPYSSLLPYIPDCLGAAGFVSIGNPQEIGIFNWKFGMQALNREVWQGKDEET
jgi:GNAT superfamily N-acetyltransferase